MKFTVCLFLADVEVVATRELLNINRLTMASNSSPRIYKLGLGPSVRNPRSSPADLRGRTTIVRASIPGSETNC